MKDGGKFPALAVVTEQRGVAFLTAIAVMAILAIVLAAFVRLMIGDVVLASYQRSTTEAFYFAESGVQEGLFRLRKGYSSDFVSSLSGETVTFEILADGSPELVIYRITGRGIVRGIQRNVSLIVTRLNLPQGANTIYGNEIETQGNAKILSGNLYSQEGIELKNWECSSTQVAFAAEEIKLDKAVYKTHAEAVEAKCPNLFPGTRVALSKAEWESLSVDAVDCRLINPAWDDGLLCKRKDDDSDTRTDDVEVYVSWEAWKNVHPSFFPYNFVDTNGNGLYDRGDPFTDVNGNGKYDPGEPYADRDGDGTFTPPEPVTSIDETKALLAVIPPWPNLDPLKYWSEADIKMRGGDPDVAAAQSTLPIYGPLHETSRPLIVLDSPGMPLTRAGGGVGHGILLVKGNLKLAGNLIWYGTIYLTGNLEGEGDATVYGSLIVRGEIDLKGTIKVFTDPASPDPLDIMIQTRSRAWHENR